MTRWRAKRVVRERRTVNTPAFARYYHRGKLTMVFRYDRYSTGLTNNPDRFVPPSGVRYSDAK